MKVNKMSISPEEYAKIEYTSHATKKQEANIQYIAMMTDVELPDESEDVRHEQEI